ncbi:MAG: DUF1016 domain-containing protein [bacterium]|nr:DUF1016 domain-containing protein [bacterium]
MSDIKSSDYNDFLSDIKEKIHSARIKASRIVNRELNALYWNIGKAIVEKQKELGWGKSIVEKLSADLCTNFPGISGFSTRNLWDMKRFYEQYHDHENLRQLVAEIPWGHNLLIMNKISDYDARKYYIEASIQNSWSRNVLLNQVKADSYKHHVLIDKQHNFEKTLPEHQAEQADKTMKDVYTLDFLGISKPVLEYELEQRMINGIRDVLIEFGHGFAFIGNQYKMKLNNKDYYVDLLFFNRKLKCLVAVDLKVGEFKAEYAGKMNLYLNLLDDYEREDGETSSIGIILCAERDRIEVEYSLRGIDKPMGVAEYRLTKTLVERLKDKLSSV